MPRKIEKRGENTYRFNISGGIGAGGRQIVHRKTVTVKNDRQLEREYAKFLTEIENGKIATQGNMTLHDFFYYWEEHSEHEESTRDFNSNIFVRIDELLGHKKINKIKPENVLEFIKILQTEPCKDPNEKRRQKKSETQDDTTDKKKEKKKVRYLSPNTIRKHYALLNTLLNQAKRWRFIVINPCEYVEPPKVVKKQKSVPNEKVTDELLKLLSQEDVKHQLLCLLAFTGGLRREEIFGLEWSDVNLTEGTVTIHQASVYVRGKGIQTKKPKTEGSARRVSLPPEVMSLLEQHKLNQDATAAKLGKDLWEKSNRIFTTVTGGIAHPHSFNNWLRRFIARSNLPKMSPHIFRHMTATYLINSGVDVTTVSEKLGHTQKSTTMNIYSHLLRKTEQQTANVMSEIINKSHNIIENEEEKPPQN